MGDEDSGSGFDTLSTSGSACDNSSGEALELGIGMESDIDLSRGSRSNRPVMKVKGVGVATCLVANDQIIERTMNRTRDREGRGMQAQTQTQTQTHVETQKQVSFILYSVTFLSML